MKDRFPRGGYVGKWLRVELSGGSTFDEMLDEEMLSQYIGGTGLGVRLLYRETVPGRDTYAAENSVIFASGPLTGTLIPGSGTISVISRNALTGFLTASQANGFFGARMKFAGYDGIILQGKAEKLVYLHINNGHVTLEDAAFLSGKGTYETDILLRKKHGENGFDDQISVAAIGPAGENQVRFACVSMDRGHIAASGGVGSALGSKNLKAIVVHGSRGIPIHADDKDAFLKKVLQWRHEALNSSMGKIVSQVGSIGFFTGYHRNGWVPVKNLTTNIFPGEEKFKAEYIRNEIYEGIHRSCFTCTYNHCQIVKVKKGAYKGFVGEEVEYEILAGFGPNWGIYDPGAVTMLNSLNDNLGMDAKEISFVISMIMEGYEKGMVSRADLEGLDMKWGNTEAAAEMLKKIAAREGIGNLLAEGVFRAARKLGKDFPEIAVYVKRGNAPHVHDSRVRWGTLFNQIVSDMGSQEGLDLTGRGSADLGVEKPTSEPDEYLGEINAKTEWLRQFQESLTYCYYQTASLKTLVETVNILTGSSYTQEDALRVGKRIVNLMRMFNLREGLSVEDDSFSPRLQMPPIDGPGKGRSLAPTFEKVRNAYYRAAGWDESGVPKRELLEELNLDFTIQNKNT